MQFEEEQNKVREEAKKRKEAQQKERTINNDIQDEIRRRYGDNPVYQSPMFQNLFSTAQNMSDAKAQELMQNPLLMSCLNDPKFAQKIAEVAANPAAGAKYANDPEFMKAFGQVLGAFK